MAVIRLNRVVGALLLLSQAASALALATGRRGARSALERPVQTPLSRGGPAMASATADSESSFWGPKVKGPFKDMMADPYNCRKDLSTDSWFKHLRSIPKSLILKRIQGHLAFNILLAAVTVRLRAIGWVPPAIGGAHGLTGAFLGLLVTFRTNNAYGRYWEARILWGGIMNTCRNLAVGASVWIKPRKPDVAKSFVQELMRYPTQTAKQCRFQAFEPGDAPTDVCLRMQTWLRRSALPSSWDQVGLYELQLAEQARHVDKLVDATGALNRIINTPMPISYGRHTSRALSIWLGTLPCTLGPSVGPLTTIAVVGLASWFILGIDAVGQLLEQPFSQPADVGDGFDFGLPVENLGGGIAKEIERIGSAPELDGALVPV